MKDLECFLCSKKSNMVVAFANEKGGVGKSTLCMTFATYLSAQGKKVHVIDADPQQSLIEARRMDLEGREYLSPEVTMSEIDIQTVTLEEIGRLRQGDDFYLLDMQGAYDIKILFVLAYCDVIVVPFQYERLILDETSRFGATLMEMQEMVPDVRRDFIFVPNRVNRSVGRKADKEQWERWRQAIAEKVTLSPEIPSWVCMQRISTLVLDPGIQKAAAPCFDFILERINILKNTDLR